MTTARLLKNSKTKYEVITPEKPVKTEEVKVEMKPKKEKKLKQYPVIDEIKIGMKR